ncbi:hypothetical protein, partial [Burkholderia cenocepacia]|uniref:hypothetical protein n=1 Tax=Burkholderia cenocepacia TaxID=95486 RepID=UPI00406D1E41
TYSNGANNLNLTVGSGAGGGGVVGDNRRTETSAAEQTVREGVRSQVDLREGCEQEHTNKKHRRAST